MIGRSDAFLAALEQIRTLAASADAVWIEGEPGTGKTLAARTIHALSERGERPFIVVNGAALSDERAGCDEDGNGRVRPVPDRWMSAIARAEGGTLCLDGVEGSSPKVQDAVRRLLRNLRRLPGAAFGERVVGERGVDVRLIATGRCDLSPWGDGADADLQPLLRRAPLCLPPLRERRGDARLLAVHFIEQACRALGCAPRRLDEDVSEWLDRYEWPGNVRELESLVRRACLADDGPAVRLPRPARGPNLESDDDISYRRAKGRAIAAFETRFLSRVMQRAQGNVSAAARMIGTERRHLGRLLKKYGIERDTVPMLPAAPVASSDDESDAPV